MSGLGQSLKDSTLRTSEAIGRFAVQRDRRIITLEQTYKEEVENGAFRALVAVGAIRSILPLAGYSSVHILPFIRSTEALEELTIDHLRASRNRKYPQLPHHAQQSLGRTLDAQRFIQNLQVDPGLILSIAQITHLEDSKSLNISSIYTKPSGVPLEYNFPDALQTLKRGLLVNPQLGNWFAIVMENNGEALNPLMEGSKVVLGQ